MRASMLLKALLTLSVLLVSACIDAAPADPASRSVKRYSAADPFPSGEHWPTANGRPLEGPFKMLPPSRAFVVAKDSTPLNVWVLRPDLPAGVTAPVVLWSAPYFGTTMASGDDPSLWDNSSLGEAVPVKLLVENGYAVAIMNLRGSGLSGGCFTLFGSEDWDDNAAVVEWLGTQPWSNGRVGMMGLSYHGTTPWQAAVRAPEHLKTIVTAGMINNLYTFFHSPQGSAQAVGPAFSSLVFGLVATVPPNERERIVSEWLPKLSQRACPETLDVLTEVYRSAYTDVRSQTFWEERRIIKDFPKIKAAILMTHGLRDLSGHATEEDPVWQAVPEDVPKRMVYGQWGHMFPNYSSNWKTTREEWDNVHLRWFDYWLKGIGTEAPGVGRSEFQDDSLTWHYSDAWPPSEARDEVLYLCAPGIGGLSATSCDASRNTFRSAPTSLTAQDFICGNPNPAIRAAQERTGLVFVSEPMPANVTLAGNPFALLRLSADQPGGLITLYAYETDGSGKCGPGFRRMTFGSADLRHHAANYVGRDFPLNTPTEVRLDLTNLAESIAPGNRIAVVATYADGSHYEGVPYTPQLTIHGGSHIVWPVLIGTLGGSEPPLREYPPRPWMPNR